MGTGMSDGLLTDQHGGHVLRNEVYARSGRF